MPIQRLWVGNKYFNALLHNNKLKEIMLLPVLIPYDLLWS